MSVSEDIERIPMMTPWLRDMAAKHETRLNAGEAVPVVTMEIDDVTGEQVQLRLCKVTPERQDR